jgi:hypothetical protein
VYWQGRKDYVKGGRKEGMKDGESNEGRKEGMKRREGLCEGRTEGLWEGRKDCVKGEMRKISSYHEHVWQ